jgi:hypothetical protein
MAGVIPAAGAPLYAELTAFLAEVNGQDSYDAKAAAVGKLSVAHFMKLPAGLPRTPSDPDHVGTAAFRPALTIEQMAQIYALNKNVFEEEATKIRGALLRLELYMAGWCTGDYEVSEEAAPADAVAVMNADLPTIVEIYADARHLAVLLPLAAEYTFRTMGHHFLTAQASEYVARYNRFFAACALPDLANYLAPAILYHRVAHWVPIGLALAVASSEAQVSKLPNAVIVRRFAAPAGSALVATSAAILEAMDGTGLRSALDEASGIATEEISKFAIRVKRNPAAFHTMPFAYGHAALPEADRALFDSQRENCRKLAPVLQGFIDALPKTSDLAGAKAILKYADTNPLLRKKAKVFFSEVGKTKATTMAEIFSMDKRSASAKDEDEVDDSEM